MDEVIAAYLKDVDCAALAANRALSPQQRFDKFDRAMVGIMELHRAGVELRGRGRRERENTDANGETVKAIGRRMAG